jgi:hypothetical protein
MASLPGSLSQADLLGMAGPGRPTGELDNGSSAPPSALGSTAPSPPISSNNLLPPGVLGGGAGPAPPPGGFFIPTKPPAPVEPEQQQPAEEETRAEAGPKSKRQHVEQPDGMETDTVPRLPERGSSPFSNGHSHEAEAQGAPEADALSPRPHPPTDPEDGPPGEGSKAPQKHTVPLANGFGSFQDRTVPASSPDPGEAVPEEEAIADGWAGGDGLDLQLEGGGEEGGFALAGVAVAVADGGVPAAFGGDEALSVVAQREDAAVGMAVEGTWVGGAADMAPEASAAVPAEGQGAGQADATSYYYSQYAYLYQYAQSQGYAEADAVAYAQYYAAQYAAQYESTGPTGTVGAVDGEAGAAQLAGDSAGEQAAPEAGGEALGGSDGGAAGAVPAWTEAAAAVEDEAAAVAGEPGHGGPYPAGDRHGAADPEDAAAGPYYAQLEVEVDVQAAAVAAASPGPSPSLVAVHAEAVARNSAGGALVAAEVDSAVVFDGHGQVDGAAAAAEVLHLVAAPLPADLAAAARTAVAHHRSSAVSAAALGGVPAAAPAAPQQHHEAAPAAATQLGAGALPPGAASGRLTQLSSAVASVVGATPVASALSAAARGAAAAAAAAAASGAYALAAAAGSAAAGAHSQHLSDEDFDCILHPGDPAKLDGPMPWELSEEALARLGGRRAASLCANWHLLQPDQPYTPAALQALLAGRAEAEAGATVAAPVGAEPAWPAEQPAAAEAAAAAPVEGVVEAAPPAAEEALGSLSSYERACRVAPFGQPAAELLGRPHAAAPSEPSPMTPAEAPAAPSPQAPSPAAAAGYGETLMQRRQSVPPPPVQVADPAAAEPPPLAAGAQASPAHVGASAASHGLAHALPTPGDEPTPASARTDSDPYAAYDWAHHPYDLPHGHGGSPGASAGHSPLGGARFDGHVPGGGVEPRSHGSEGEANGLAAVLGLDAEGHALESEEDGPLSSPERTPRPAAVPPPPVQATSPPQQKAVVVLGAPLSAVDAADFFEHLGEDEGPAGEAPEQSRAVEPEPLVELVHAAEPEQPEAPVEQLEAPLEQPEAPAEQQDAAVQEAWLQADAEAEAAAVVAVQEAETAAVVAALEAEAQAAAQAAAEQVAPAAEEEAAAASAEGEAAEAEADEPEPAGLATPAKSTVRASRHAVSRAAPDLQQELLACGWEPVAAVLDALHPGSRILTPARSPAPFPQAVAALGGIHDALALLAAATDEAEAAQALGPLLASISSSIAVRAIGAAASPRTRRAEQRG